MTLEIGKVYEFSKTITDADIILFAGITGDFNPLHIDQVWAEKTRFRGKIAHGMLSAGLISAAIGMHFPGTIYLSQELKFIAPVHIGDTITAQVEAIEIIKDKARLRTTCINQDGVIVIGGSALVMLP